MTRVKSSRKKLSWPSQKRVRTFCVLTLNGARGLPVSPNGSRAPPSPEICGGAFWSAHDQKLRRIAVVEVVGETRGDVGSESCHASTTAAADGWRRKLRYTQFVAGEEPSDVYLAGRSLRQLVIAIAGHEVPLIAEVVVEPADEEVILCREVQGGLVNSCSLTPSQVWPCDIGCSRRHSPAGSYLFHICWTTGLMPIWRGSICARLYCSFHRMSRDLAPRPPRVPGA